MTAIISNHAPNGVLYSLPAGGAPVPQPASVSPQPSGCVSLSAPSSSTPPLQRRRFLCSPVCSPSDWRPAARSPARQFRRAGVHCRRFMHRMLPVQPSHATKPPTAATSSAATGGLTVQASVPVNNKVMSPLAVDPSCPQPPCSLPLGGTHCAVTPVTTFVPPHVSTIPQPIMTSTGSMRAMVAAAVGVATPLATATLASPTPDQPSQVVRVLSASAGTRAKGGCERRPNGPDGVTAGHVLTPTSSTDAVALCLCPPLVPLAGSPKEVR